LRRGGGRLRHRRAHALHVAQDAFGHLLEVGLALAQVLVLHVVELARQHFQLGGQRPLGVVEALGDPVLHAADQVLVLQQHQVDVEQRRQLVRRLLRAHPAMVCCSRWISSTTALRPARGRARSRLDLVGSMK
jgi:hypothetical protein